MYNKYAQYKEDFQTPAKPPKNNEPFSPYNILETSDNKSKIQPATKTKIMSLMKKVAELELREGKYIQKIKYLETANMRISRENQEKIISSRLESNDQMLKSLQQSITRKLGQSEVKDDNSRQLNITRQIGEISRDRENWIKKYQDLIEKSNRSIETEKQKRIQFEYENKYLKSIINNYQTRIENSYDVKPISQPKPDRPEKQKEYSAKVGLLLTDIDALEKQNKDLRKRNSDIENQFVKLQVQIAEKFNFLQEQITLYEAEKQQNQAKIKNLREQLSIRQSRHYFSFSHKDMVENETQTSSDQCDMDLNCFKSSIESLLEQNNTLKVTLANLQAFISENNLKLPKQLSIQCQLNKKRTA